jgi:hypothetical protein
MFTSQGDNLMEEHGCSICLFCVASGVVKVVTFPVMVGKGKVRPRTEDTKTQRGSRCIALLFLQPWL